MRKRETVRLVATAVLVFLATAAHLPQAAGQQTRTLKEQLSDKASDEQRVDNCGVPPERRGPVPRPDCADKASPDATAGSAVANEAQQSGGQQQRQ